MGRSARALISRSALAHNLSRVRQSATTAQVMAVVKADAYGHGVALAVDALREADAFAVACVPEGLALRELGVERPVAVLQGYGDETELAACIEAGLDPVLHQPWQIDALERLDAERALEAWLKIDTGMHRLGFPPAEVAGLWQRLQQCRALRSPPRLLTHMANADDPADPYTDLQLQEFREGTAGMIAERSIGNSACVLAWPDAHADWVRPGIMLYGVSPFEDRHGTAIGLRPAMELETRLIAVKRLARGDRVGYGGTWTAPVDMRLGVAAIGYGDGYPRHAPSGTPVLVDGERVELVGRVSMDMITLDLRTAPAAQVGSRVTLWGGGLPIEEIARRAGTIGYELLCGIAGRVERIEVE